MGRVMWHGLFFFAAMSADDLPVVEFAFPGPLRDQLVAAILAGEKTTTTGLVADTTSTTTIRCQPRGCARSWWTPPAVSSRSSR